MVCHGSWLVFDGSRLVFHCFSWFQVGFLWFFSRMYPPKLYPGPTIQSKSTALQAALDQVMMVMMVKVMMMALLVIARGGFGTECSRTLGGCIFCFCVLVLLYVNVLPKLVWSHDQESYRGDIACFPGLVLTQHTDIGQAIKPKSLQQPFFVPNNLQICRCNARVVLWLSQD